MIVPWDVGGRWNSLALEYKVVQSGDVYFLDSIAKGMSDAFASSECVILHWQGIAYSLLPVIRNVVGSGRLKASIN